MNADPLFARLLSALVALVIAIPASAAEPLDERIGQAVAATLEEFKHAKLAEDQLSVSVIDLHDAANPRTGSFRGDAPTFPASVVKLFYLAYAQRLLEDGKLADAPEFQRGLRDMIVDSSNDATGYVLDAITDAPNGALLPPAEMEQWTFRRNAVNRFFAGLGYEKINANQKAYCEGPYGRERDFIGPKYENRNKLTTNTTAKLLAEVARRRFISPARSDAMMMLLSRDRAKKSGGPDDQAHGFIAGALPPSAKVWSKAGWTSTARHDAAYVDLKDGRKGVIVIFTTGQARERDLIPHLGRRLLDLLRSTGAVPSHNPLPDNEKQ